MTWGMTGSCKDFNSPISKNIVITIDKIFFNSINGRDDLYIEFNQWEMEADKLIKKIVYKEVPARVEYELTDLGVSLSPALLMLSVQGEKNHKKLI